MLNDFPQDTAMEVCRGVSKKFYCVIEVKVPSGVEGWQRLVNSRMGQVIEKLKLSVEELGGKVFVRY